MPPTDTASRTVARQCTLCEAHCGILVTVAGDHVERIEGDPQDVLSQGYICPKATALADLHEDPERLRQPVRRVGDRFEPISWDEAFDLVGTNLRRIRREHGRNAIGMYLGNPAAHSPSVLSGGLLRLALFTRHAWSASSVDQFPQEFVAWQMFGANLLMPVADIDRTDHLVIMGANPAVSNGSITTMPGARDRIRAVRDRGGRVVVIDPRRTETARLADEHVAVRPGGDPWLLMGMLHTLFEEGLVDEDVVAGGHLGDLVQGLEVVRDLVSEASPEACSEAAGVDAATIRRLAREHAAATSGVLYARIGVCHHTTGTVTHWLVNVLNAVTGNLDQPGGQMWAHPAVDLLPLLRRVPARYDAWRSRNGEHAAFRFELPVAGMADDLLLDGDDRVRALITYAGNPVLSSAHDGRLVDALEGLDFHVAVDLYVTETSRHADVILPPMSHLERDEYDFVFPVFGVRNTARYNARVFEPAPDAKEDWEILTRLAAEVLPLPLPGVTGPVARTALGLASPMRIAALAVAAGPYGILRKGLRGLTMGRIRAARGGIDLGPLRPRLRELLATDDLRVHLAPDPIVAEARRLLRDGAADGQPDGIHDLQLIGRRHLRSNNSWLHNIASMVKGSDRCTALLHPDDAAARGLDDQDTVVVSSPHGRIEVPLEVSDEIRPGTVAIPHGWGHDLDGVGWSTAAAHPGANVNQLHDPSLVDVLTGNAALNGTRVRVEAVGVIDLDRMQEAVDA